MCHEFGQKPILEPWGRACTAVTGYMLSRARGKEPYSNASRRERVCGSTCRDEARVYTVQLETEQNTGSGRGLLGVLLSPHRTPSTRRTPGLSPLTRHRSALTTYSVLSNTTTYTPHDPPPPSQAGADAGRRDYVAMDRLTYYQVRPYKVKPYIVHHRATRRACAFILRGFACSGSKMVVLFEGVGYTSSIQVQSMAVQRPARVNIHSCNISA
eukprot:scaffold33356_cov49-Phaeocystis_antarctica.AAC.2